MKLNVSLDDELVKRIDEYADENYMSRSGLLSIAAAQYLNQNAMYKAISSMAITMQKIADSNSIDIQTKSELEEFQRFCNYVVNAQK